MAKDPKTLLADNLPKLDAWIADPSSERPAIALGAIGELVAAKALNASIVSAQYDTHDLEDGSTAIEVKARMEGVKWRPKLGKKRFQRIVRVTLSLRPKAAGGSELWAKEVEIRDRYDNSPNNWSAVAGFTPHRVP